MPGKIVREARIVQERGWYVGGFQGIFKPASSFEKDDAFFDREVVEFSVDASICEEVAEFLLALRAPGVVFMESPKEDAVCTV